MKKPIDILYENLELILTKLIQIEYRTDVEDIPTFKLINQVRTILLSSIELIKNKKPDISPALDKKLREDIKKLKQSIDLLLNH